MGKINWIKAESSAWLPPVRLSPVVWTETYRILPASTSAEPGRFNWSRTPFWKEICDTAQNNNIQQVVCLKPTQVGWSELQRSILAWQIDQEPGPALFVLPSEKAARELVDERIRPLIESTPVIAGHLSPNPDDFTKSGIRFDSMQLFTAWAGSPQSLASRPVRYCFFDEVDKYPPFSGREADPISLGIERTATYGYRAKSYIGSTPTLTTGTIFRAFENCDDQKCYFIPCPHCRHYQRLVLPQLKFPESNLEKNKRAAQIELAQSAYYECEACKGQIQEQNKNRFLNAGVWVSGSLLDGQWVAKQKVNNDGIFIGDSPKAKRVGYWINSLYSPWKSFSAVAAEFLRSHGDLGKMMNFKNSWMAEPFEDEVGSIKAADIEIMREKAPAAGIIPEWAQLIIASADVQLEGNLCYYVVRAWGEDYKSQLIEFGTVGGVEKLEEVLNKVWSIGNDKENGEATISMMLIDSKYMSNRVFNFAATDARIVPIIGSSVPNMTPCIRNAVGSKEHGIERKEINTTFFKNQHEDRRKEGKWLVNNAITDEYCRHLSAEHKIKDPKTGNIIWTQRSSGGANHLFDCEIYNHAGADLAGVGLLASQNEQETQQDNIQQESLGIF